MAGFRLKMATQLGEKTAADAGYAAFPIDPIAIARSRDIDVQAKPSHVKGISGAMIMAAGSVTVIYSSEYNNTGFEHFCVAHELGHYCLPGHPEEIQKQGGTHFSRAGFTQNSSIELEADHFASGLLLPSRLTREFLSRKQIGLQGILDLADAAECSRTAAATTSLYAYEADLGVLGEIPEGREFEVLKLNSTPIIAFASAQHSLAGTASMSFAELASHPLVMRERGSKTRQKLESMASAQGIELKPAVEAEGREAVREIVASGGGIGFVSAAEFGQDSRLVPISINAPEMLMDEALICLRERSGGKMVRAFLDVARTMAAGD